MRSWHQQPGIASTLVALALILVGLMIAGCGGNSPASSINLLDPPSDPGAPRAVGGSVFTLAQGQDTEGGVAYVIDLTRDAEVTLTALPGNPTPISEQTNTSSTGGGYLFQDIPPGEYQVVASATSSNGGTVTCAPVTVHVDDTMPTMMVNLLLGTEANIATITGTITVDGTLPANGLATVSIDIEAPPAAILQGTFVSPDQYPTIILPRTVPIANGSGTFTFQVPAGADGYYLAAQMPNSRVAESGEVFGVTAGATVTVTPALTLTAATGATAFPQLESSTYPMSLTSNTLPAPTQEASDQALITRLAAARAGQASRRDFVRLEQMATRRQRSRQSLSGSIVENDLTWTFIYPGEPDRLPDPNMLGYRVYRSNAPSGDFLRIGTLPDPYLTFFTDNDPAGLAVGKTVYYTVVAYASTTHGAPSRVLTATPLPQITITDPLPTNTVGWSTVTGAQSYLIMVFDESPTFNAIPALSAVVSKTITSVNLATSPDLSVHLTPGTYWWAVAAYNGTTASGSTAASFSAYRPITIQ